MANTSKGHLVLITGSRGFNKQQLVEEEVDQLPPGCIVLHGGAIGADRMAADHVHTIKGLIELRVPYLRVYEKAGGFRRNEAMVKIMKVFRDQGFDCWAIAFHHDIQHPTKGTTSMVNLLNAEGFSIIHVDAAKGGQY